MEFETNVRLHSGTVLTVTGLNPTSSAPGNLIISSTQSTYFASQGQYLGGNNGTLYVRLIRHTDAGTKYSFSVMLKNSVMKNTDVPVTAARDDGTRLLRRAQDVYISAGCISAVRMEPHLALDLSTLSGTERIPGAIPGDAAPLLLFYPHWVRKDIGQSTPYPGTANTLTVTLSTNVPLAAECSVALTIFGLTDRSVQFNSGRYLDLVARQTDNFAANYTTPWLTYDLDGLNRGQSSENISAVALVPPRDGDLLLAPRTGACKLRGNGDDQMQFTNRLTADKEQGVGRWEGNYVRSVSFQSVGAGVTSRGRLLMKGPNGFNRDIGNYSIVNGVAQPLNWTRGISMPAGGYIALVPHTGVTVNASVTYQTDKRLIFYPYDKTNAFQNYTFSFEIENPVSPQQSPSISISADGEVLIAAESMARDKGKPCCTTCTPTGTADDGDAEPYKVHPPMFCTRTISQSNHYPCGENKLSVTLTANVPLLAKKSVIIISNLSKAEFETGTINIWDESGGAHHHLLFGEHFKARPGTGFWDNGNKILKLFLLGDTESATDYMFSFSIFNAPSEQLSPPNIQVEAHFVVCMHI
jgi:hypothetical protein